MRSELKLCDMKGFQKVNYSRMRKSYDSVHEKTSPAEISNPSDSIRKANIEARMRREFGEAKKSFRFLSLPQFPPSSSTLQSGEHLEKADLFEEAETIRLSREAANKKEIENKPREALQCHSDGA